MNRHARYWCLLALTLAAGCGPRTPPIEKTVPVRGSVVLASGAALPGGLITFHPTDRDRGEARGIIGKDGRFELGTYGINDGVMPGAYKVTVEPVIFDGRGNPRLARSLPIPRSYTEADSSTLTVEITDPGDENLQVVLR